MHRGEESVDIAQIQKARQDEKKLESFVVLNKKNKSTKQLRISIQQADCRKVDIGEDCNKNPQENQWIEKECTDDLT